MDKEGQCIGINASFDPCGDCYIPFVDVISCHGDQGLQRGRTAKECYWAILQQILHTTDICPTQRDSV